MDTYTTVNHLQSHIDYQETEIRRWRDEVARLERENQNLKQSSSGEVLVNSVNFKFEAELPEGTTETSVKITNRYLHQEGESALLIEFAAAARRIWGIIKPKIGSQRA